MREFCLRCLDSILMVEFGSVCIEFDSLIFLSAVQVRSGVGRQRLSNGIIRNRDHSHRCSAGSAANLWHWLERFLRRMARRQPIHPTHRERNHHSQLFQLRLRVTGDPPIIPHLPKARRKNMLGKALDERFARHRTAQDSLRFLGL